MFYESLPDDFWIWYESVRAKSSDIISLTNRVKRRQISIDYLDPVGTPRRDKFFVDPARNTEHRYLVEHGVCQNLLPVIVFGTSALTGQGFAGD
ncbi:protein of unknown function [Caballeronia sp. S22]